MKFPEKCPYCGKDITEHQAEKNHFEKHVGDFQAISAEVHRCPHCENPIYICREYRFNNGTPYKEPNGILAYFPIIDTLDYPVRVKELSEQAYIIFQDAHRAYQNGLNSLVGAGLRMALEWLVWDYLIKIKNIPETDLEKLKLFERIQKMDAPLYTNICAKLIRMFGNDQVHIIKKLDFTFDEVFNAYNILCDLINNELDLIEIQKRLTT